MVALTVLVLAWGLAAVCDGQHLNTAGFLVELTRGGWLANYGLYPWMIAGPVLGFVGMIGAALGLRARWGVATLLASSIGIFGIMFDLSNFFDDKLGITFDEVRTGEYGDTYTVTRPLTQAEKNIIQKNLEEYYNTFTSKAAEGRDVAHEEIQRVASGRVWTGAQAQERNLVDVLGGFNDAVRIAAEKAGVADDYKVRYYPEPKNFLEELMTSLEQNARAGAIKNELGEMYPWYEQAQKVQQYHGAQARLPFEMHFH